MKEIAVLGSTGSIGTQTLDIVRQHTGKVKVKALASSKFSQKLKEQIEEFRPKYVYVHHYETIPKELIKKYDLIFLTGEEGLLHITDLFVDLYVVGIAGIAGILPTYYILEHKKNLATANKEAIICLGEILKKQYKKIIPIDSEHSAIFQSLKGEKTKNIKKIVLTASGGPFLNLPIESFKDVSVEEALQHPKWKMGEKVTIDSATLMNKGLEIIEAHYLFDTPYSHIDVLIHPQSLVHGMVEYIDGTIISNISVPDMKIPITYAISYPDRWETDVPSVDFKNLHKIEFFEPDYQKFPLLKLAKEVGIKGEAYPIVLTVADELAVNRFLSQKITFDKIPVLIQKVIERANFGKPKKLEDIIQIMEETQEIFKQVEKEVF
ncbi:MAG: 1-deoxy-D-xylulose-5-phosphate reductoisomerase [Aquificae bacterium]|nr:1-deoxy-D-xylulose-5-phosphate reductoisomerase [Aquificota bacterium]